MGNSPIKDHSPGRPDEPSLAEQMRRVTEKAQQQAIVDGLNRADQVQERQAVADHRARKDAMSCFDGWVNQIKTTAESGFSERYLQLAEWDGDKRHTEWYYVDRFLQYASDLLRWQGFSVSGAEAHYVDPGEDDSYRDYTVANITVYWKNPSEQSDSGRHRPDWFMEKD